MIPGLLLPAALAALAALLLPLLIHLARREDERPVVFAALRWLAPRARPRRRLRFEDRRLLAVRLLLIVLIALLLARPVLPHGETAGTWVVALPGLGAEALAADAPPDAERRWLAPGFPAIEDGRAAPPTRAPATSLLRELDMQMPAGAALVVLVPSRLDGVDAERPRLSRPVDWRVVEAPTAAAGAGSGDSAAAPPPRLRIVAPGPDAGARYLQAVEAAWRSQDAAVRPSGKAGIHPEPTEPLEVRAWLAAGPLPADASAWVAAGGTALLAHHTRLPALEGAPVLWRDDDGRPLLRGTPLGAGRALQWTRPLRPDAMPGLLDAGFPQRLHEVLLPPPVPGRVAAAGHAPLHAEGRAWPRAQRSLAPWLALVIGLVFVLERWLASAPRRGRPA